MTPDIEDGSETKLICPLCGKQAPGHKVEDRSLYEFEEHGRCGHFVVGFVRKALIARESDEQRERYRREVLAANTRGIIQLL